jgi:hypothetical protein
MPLRRAPIFALGLLVVPALAAACGGNHSLFGTGAGEGGSGGGGTTSGNGGRATSSSSGATTSSSSSSTSTTSGSTQYPAPFPAPPQVITFGGPVLSSPQIYPVFFAGDDAATVASLADFTQNIGATSYWTATTSEYGVGKATGHPAIKLSQAAPSSIDDSTLQSWLATEFAGSDGFPTPDANTLIVLYYPSGTTITLQGAQSCQDFGGYHNSADVNGQQIAYAVVPRCSGITTTGAASHELIEAVTDPQPMMNPAYGQVDDGDLVWELLLGGGEVGDMCAQFPNVFTTFAPFSYTVQRTWSNKAAKAGHDPCVPQLPGEVYFNAAPVLPDLASLDLQGQTAMLKAVKIPVGQSKTIPVQLFSDGPTAPWTVTAVDPAVSLGAPSPLLSFSFDKTTGSNGDTLHLTITVMAAGQGNVEVFFLKSTSGATHFDWFATVAN